MARFQRFQQPTTITLTCGKQVTVISACFVKHLWGFTGNSEFCIGGILPNGKRVYMQA